MNKELENIVVEEFLLTRSVLKSHIDECLNSKDSSTRDLDGLFERCDNIDKVLKEMNSHERILG
jgi:hypothetical protein|tara:strand:+ start:438 stop:629 length:192 start_codon:yes stop_codon:yes gene_type:complete